MLPEFDKCIRYQVNNGQKISFWNDIRCGDISLSNQFPSIFMVDSNQKAVVSDYYQLLGGRAVWVFNIRRHLLDHESDALVHLLSKLESVSISFDSEDERLWYPDSKGVFSVRTFYNALTVAQGYDSCWK